jgi:glycosyltransferase involved in cell wall biosynthesis
MIPTQEIPPQVVGLFDGETDTRPVMVTVRCTAYNQEPFIRQTLEGFVMQKTNFRFEVIVHDDASTDGTARIIREFAEKYPDIIRPIYETENQYSKHDDSLRRVLDACLRGKYIAYCEGDDYWIDPLKLQKQVDFLESHPDYGAVYTNFEAFYNDTKQVKKMRFVPRSGWQYETMMLDQLDIWTLTTMCRSEFTLTKPKFPSGSEVFNGDISLFMYITSKSKVHCIDEVTARYRILKNSASHSTDRKTSVLFQYKCANTHLWWLEHGPKVSDLLRMQILTKIVATRRIRYAIVSQRVDIIKSTEFPLRYVKSCRQLLIWTCCKTLRYRPIIRLASLFVK